jgi:hypothetical protein
MTVQLLRTQLEYWLTLLEQRMAIAELGHAATAQTAQHQRRT